MKNRNFLFFIFLYFITVKTLAQKTVVNPGLYSVIDDPVILFQEDFEDTDFASRGWYDHLSGTITTDEHIDGSSACFECKFLIGNSGCEGGTPGRHLFDETEEVYISFYVKYSSNYTGSDKPYHPHEFYFLTTENSKWVGPAWTHLTTYIEHNEGVPLLSIQDGENIDESNIGVDLSGVTEERAVAGCNGDSDGYGEGDCYFYGNGHRNGKQWRADTIYFSDEEGSYYKNDWHFIEAYFKLNSVVDGFGVADGKLKYWYDGETVLDFEDVMFRTAAFPDMKFNQFLMAPYIGPGSPVEQYMWVDDMTVATSRDSTSSIDGDLLQTAADEIIQLKNYPNPFREQTIINYKISNSSHIELNIYDSNGEKVCQLVSEKQSPGNYEYELITSNLGAGIYYCRFISDRDVRQIKLILLR